MAFKNRTYTSKLDGASIDEASAWLVENLEELEFDKTDILRTRLAYEEALLNMRDHYGEEQEVTAYLEKSFGRYRFRVSTKGDRFNPLHSLEEDSEEMPTSLFAVLEARAQYSYSLGTNVLRIPLPKKSMNPILRIVIAISVGVIAGLITNIIIPNNLQLLITDVFLQPLSDAWVRLLQLVSGPVIFLTALTAAFETRHISDFGGSRLMTMARYFGLGAAATIFALICFYAFNPFEVDFTAADRDAVSSMLDSMLHVIPNDILEPFKSANTPQLLLVAIVLGFFLAILSDQTVELRTVIRQANVVSLTLAQKTCSLVPYIVGLLVFLKIWTQDFDMLVKIWQPLVFATLVSLVALALVIAYVSIQAHMSPLLLARKLKDPFINALKTGSLNYFSVDDLANSCMKHLGIKREFSKAILPQGLVLYMPTSAIGIIVFILFAAESYALDIDYMWVLTATAMAIVLAVATPPLNGANLLAFVVAFSYLSIPNDALLDAMVFDIIFGVFSIAADQALLQLETLLQAKSMDFVNLDALRAPYPTK